MKEEVLAQKTTEVRGSTGKSFAFHVTDAEMNWWPVKMDSVPPAELFTALVKQVGAAAKNSRRVEVAFERIAPPADQIWSRDSRFGIEIPLGRAGATKLQYLRLGLGTSQHMLVAGKTGSGKSTLLHAIITNTALYYSPEEVNFFLIDFKKGVEFKSYAAARLPHARVIAIESDREFGVSVLQRLDRVLEERGELFRRASVQDIGGYRQTGRKLPRMMLLIDEFQEFFVEDDRTAQTAALHLDRLVRQGRAFGVHIVLGSQTLGGAYSLARSTLGQVAVRVALQCSEADAHLILSEDNSAARLLTRPGEAIYNDANGLVEGNHPFQIAWLGDDKRDRYLAELLRLATIRKIAGEPAIIFEGNIPSDPERNPALTRLFEDPTATSATAPVVWLGEAVEIKDPASVVFARQTAANLLLVGQDQEAALGTLSHAVLSAIGLRETDPVHPLVYVVDGTNPDSPEQAIWQRVAELRPHAVRRIGVREIPAAIAELYADLKRREQDGEKVHPSRFLVVHNIGRFRDLRKADDDFSFTPSSFGNSEPASLSPGKMFAELLTNGPERGLHSLVWVDSYNNVDRWFSRQTLRDFGWRIAFQMNSNDSSNLIDTPAASRLGTCRGLLFREDQGTLEKFRPYGVPSEAWLQRITHSLQSPADALPTADDLDQFFAPA